MVGMSTSDEEPTDYEDGEGNRDTTNCMAVYVAARMIWELTHDRDLCENAMYLCAHRKIREAEDWVADCIREKLGNIGRHEDYVLRVHCEWAMEHGYPDIIIACLRKCNPGALDGIKWGIPPPYRNI